MSLASNNLLKTIYKGQNPNDKATRMAKVVRNDSNSRYFLQFFGEEEPTQKSYKRIDGLSISLNQTVMLTKVNGTYVITGVVR